MHEGLNKCRKESNIMDEKHLYDSIFPEENSSKAMSPAPYHSISLASTNRHLASTLSRYALPFPLHSSTTPLYSALIYAPPKTSPTHPHPFRQLLSPKSRMSKSQYGTPSNT